MAYEKQEGDFTLNQKTSKAGNTYWSGKVSVGGKDYWITLFDGEKDGQYGKFRSGNIKPAEPRPEPAPEQVPEITDEVPF